VRSPLSALGLLAPEVSGDAFKAAAWARDLLPRVLPADWACVERGADGAKFQSDDRLTVIMSAAVEQDGKRWLHVSCSRPTRLPSWDDLRRVKDLFVGRERTALQVVPPASRHINIHPNCLHLWACLDGDVTPDFARGGDTI